MDPDGVAMSTWLSVMIIGGNIAPASRGRAATHGRGGARAGCLTRAPWPACRRNGRRAANLDGGNGLALLGRGDDLVDRGRAGRHPSAQHLAGLAVLITGAVALVLAEL